MERRQHPCLNLERKDREIKSCWERRIQDRFLIRVLLAPMTRECDENSLIHSLKVGFLLNFLSFGAVGHRTAVEKTTKKPNRSRVAYFIRVSIR